MATAHLVFGFTNQVQQIAGTLEIHRDTGFNIVDLAKSRNEQR